MEIFDLIEVILASTAVAILGLINALFSYLLDYCLWEGSIFGKWLPFISRKIASRFYRKDFDDIMREPVQAHNESFEQLMDNKKSLLYKLLGGCIICINIWFGMVSWLVIWKLSDGLFHPAYGFVYVLVASAYLRKLTGVVYK